MAIQLLQEAYGRAVLLLVLWQAKSVLGDDYSSPSMWLIWLLVGLVIFISIGVYLIRLCIIRKGLQRMKASQEASAASAELRAQGVALPPGSYPGQGSGMSAYPGQGSGIPGYPGQGSGMSAYPGQGSGIPGYPGQGSGTPGYPGQGSGTPGYPGQGSGTPGYPGQGSETPGYPGQGSGTPGYPGPDMRPPPGYFEHGQPTQYPAVYMTPYPQPPGTLPSTNDGPPHH